jgi:hypothetical protein
MDDKDKEVIGGALQTIAEQLLVFERALASLWNGLAAVKGNSID